MKNLMFTDTGKKMLRDNDLNAIFKTELGFSVDMETIDRKTAPNTVKRCKSKSCPYGNAANAQDKLSISTNQRPNFLWSNEISHSRNLLWGRLEILRNE
jgi:hypothetical protein